MRAIVQGWQTGASFVEPAPYRWVLRINLSLPGLPNKCLYPLSHLASPRTVFFLLLGWSREVTCQANFSSIEVNSCPNLSFKLLYSLWFAVGTGTY